MSLSNGVKDLWGSLPTGASYFLKRAAGLFVLWKSIYILMLLPAGEPDGWLVRSLGDATASFLNLFNGADTYRVRHLMVAKSDRSSTADACAQIYRPGMTSDVGIFPPCNGLELMVVAVGFILCFEGGWRRKALYVAASLLGVFAVNVLRCSLLTVINTGHPAYFEFAHKYLFNLSGYTFVFLIWMRYVQGLMPELAVARSNAEEE